MTQETSGDFHRITNNLWLGSVFGVEKIIGMDHIISCLNVDDLVDEFDDFKFIKEITIPRTIVDIEDAQDVDITPYLDKIADLINQLTLEDKKVYIHCYAGISRSPSFVIAYLCKYKGYKYDDALNYVRNIRGWVNPNKRFRKDVRIWTETLNFVNV